LTFAPTRVASGSDAVGTVELVAPAPAGGLVLDISSSHPAVLPVPATVTVASGATKATFTSTAAKVSGDTAVTVRVALGDQSIARGIVVHLPAPKSVTTSPTVVVGGGSVTGTVTLASKAPAGGITVSLASLDSAATVPASVGVPAGAISAKFPISTSVVGSDRAVLITAAVDGDVAATALWVRSIGLVSAVLTPTTVVGGSASTVRVNLSRAAPAGGLPVALSV